MQHGPVVRRRKLGAELRALRTSAGITSGEAARLVGWHQSKVSRIETGTSGVKPADVRLLLDVYGVDDEQLRGLLVMLARSEDAGGRHHWWHAYRGVLASATCGDRGEVGRVAGGEDSAASNPQNSASSRSSSACSVVVPVTSREPVAPPPQVRAAATAPSTTAGCRASPR
ncbi:hypothetical protein STENM36S_07793 [Streptomyces tendae]